ncbi:nitroreductase family protein [Kinneretia aquatilis]|uniref:nitroreductase family protein n=1 Tax=Kinneretia aquatilis TaxID=2070761 RepID=UPI0014950B39|nr:nitroreductase family protein [Paucibacter aquatile]WIV95959.1 nitroreductase family protein [Paucibacter aquatile]
MNELAVIHRILDLARWAPSGDNTQPWRFEIVGPHDVVVHGFDTREHCVYDLDGHPSQIALGALIETAAIAASEYGLRLVSTHRASSPEARPVFDWHFSPSDSSTRSPLIDCIQCRSVQRRPLSTTPLTASQKQTLESACGDGFEILWLEGPQARWNTAWLMFHSAKIRLTSPEAYEVHRDIIDWRKQFSTSKVPEQALGTDPMTTRLMEFVMGSWERVRFFNRFLAGTWAPRIQLDLLPSLRCGAHYVLVAKQQARTLEDFVDAGRAMQRFWLTSTHLNLQMQPEITPLVFARYARENRKFSRETKVIDLAQEVKARLEALLGTDASNRAVFMGRLGSGPAATSRSLRRPLEELIITEQVKPSIQQEVCPDLS